MQPRLKVKGINSSLCLCLTSSQSKTKVEQNNEYRIGSVKVHLHRVLHVLFIRNHFESKLVLDSLKFKKLLKLQGKS